MVQQPGAWGHAIVDVNVDVDDHAGVYVYVYVYDRKRYPYLVATQRLHLGAAQVSIESASDLSIAAGGSLRETIGGDHHTTVRGDERMEAANVEFQASTGAVAVRAMKHVALDDDPAPQPFAWSAISGDDGSGS